MHGEVYAGPAVTVTFTKENDAVTFDETNRGPENEGNAKPKSNNTEEEKSVNNETDVTEVSDVTKPAGFIVKIDADTEHIEIERNVLKDTENDAPDGDQIAVAENHKINTVKAPLASEEDLTAPEVNPY